MKQQVADGQAFVVQYTMDWKEKLQAFMVENGCTMPTGIFDKTGRDIFRRAEPPSEPDFPITFIFARAEPLPKASAAKDAPEKTAEGEEADLLLAARQKQARKTLVAMEEEDW